jgi:hypothetical protein
MPSSKINEWYDKCNEYALKSYTNDRSLHCAGLIYGKDIKLMATNTYGSNKIEQFITNNDCTTHAEMNVIIKALDQNLVGFDHSSKVELAEGVSAN